MIVIFSKLMPRLKIMFMRYERGGKREGEIEGERERGMERERERESILSDSNGKEQKL